MPYRMTINLVVAALLLFTNVPADDCIHFESCFSEPIALDSSDNAWLQPLIQWGPSEGELFRWDQRAPVILDDYNLHREKLAQSLIESGHLALIIEECAATKTATRALDKLDKAGLKLSFEGKVVPKYEYKLSYYFTR